MYIYILSTTTALAVYKVSRSKTKQFKMIITMETPSAWNSFILLVLAVVVL